MKTKKRRPAILIRFYREDIARLSSISATRCTPRENYCRSAILAQLDADEASRKADHHRLTRKRRERNL